MPESFESDADAAGTMGWPDLSYAAWTATRDTLHRWTQIVGKVRLACMPWINHSWHVTLYVTARGLTTSIMSHGRFDFQIDFDFIDHELQILRSDGRRAGLDLYPRSVADFHAEFVARLRELDLDVRFNGVPNEVEDAVPFAQDETHASYDPLYASRFWRALVRSARVMTDFRADFRGKCSPIHFFWGSFDLAVTRFSGRVAPAHPGNVPHLPDDVAREAYSHEVSSVGFWPGGDMYPHAMFYAYAYPTPAGLADARIEPAGASWHGQLGEFVLPYDAVRRSSTPDQTLRTFLDSTYEAVANLAAWDRAALEWEDERRPSAVGHLRPRHG